jgi:hypothetical protein
MCDKAGELDKERLVPEKRRRRTDSLKLHRVAREAKKRPEATSSLVISFTKHAHIMDFPHMVVEVPINKSLELASTRRIYDRLNFTVAAVQKFRAKLQKCVVALAIFE